MRCIFRLFARAGAAGGRLLLPSASRDRVVPGAASDVGRGQARTARLSSGILRVIGGASSSGRALLRASRLCWSWRSPPGEECACFSVRFLRLSIPWILVWGIKQLFLASIFVCSLSFSAYALTWPALCTFASSLCDLRIRTASAVPSDSRAASSQAYAPNDLVQNEWRDYAQGRSSGNALWFAIKFPTWTALLVALGL